MEWDITMKYICITFRGKSKKKQHLWMWWDRKGLCKKQAATSYSMDFTVRREGGILWPDDSYACLFGMFGQMGEHAQELVLNIKTY